MIVFDLRCPNDHVFEAWFGSSAEYADQQGRGLVACPICGSNAVGKAVMAPAIGMKGNQHLETAPPDRKRKEMLAKLAELQRQVEEKCDYVGRNFVAEARLRHAKRKDSAPSRGIYGEASIGDANELREEGIDVWPLPFRPRKSADA